MSIRTAVLHCNVDRDCSLCLSSVTPTPFLSLCSVLQYKGPIWGLMKGNWFGIEFHDAAHGKNDGSYNVSALLPLQPRDSGPHLVRTWSALYPAVTVHCGTLLTCIVVTPF